MRPSTIEANWHSVKKQIQQRCPDLSDDDLSAIAGPPEQLIDILRYRTGQTRPEIEQLLCDCGYIAPDILPD